MSVLLQLIFVIIRPIFAGFLALGAIIGVAASVIIMNLLVGYFSVASDAYISVHPHIVINGSWSEAEAKTLAAKLAAIDGDIARAAPALHFARTITLASVNVNSELCDPDVNSQDNCNDARTIKDPKRTYAYDVTDLRQVDVQVRGVGVIDNDTVANYRKLMSGEADLTRLLLDRDTGGNELPVAFLAQDNLISAVTGSFLITPAALAPTYTRYYRLHGVIKLGAKSGGAPLLILGLPQARALAPANVQPVNAIEIRLLTPLGADKTVVKLKEALGTSGLTYETWIDKERSAFEFLNATWVMVFSVMLSICLVVAISIYSTLTLSILRNRWKVALLGALGYTPLGISMIFLVFAIGIALTGVIGGVLLGHFASISIGGALYGALLGLPPERFTSTLTWGPAIWMASATLAIFILSAIIPVRRAVSIRPAEALSGQT